MSWNRWIIGSVIALIAFVGWQTIDDFCNFHFDDKVSQVFLPGHLSQAHTFLKNQCTACHSPNQGVSAVGCISCHANNINLLQRESTVFHATVTSCKECHQEHRGGAKPPLSMDHVALAQLGVGFHKKELDEFGNQIVRNFLKKRHANEVTADIISLNANEKPIVSTLNCTSCHAGRDQHKGFFGVSCLSCHSSQSWQIAEYKHPSPNSRTCVQCHQAPPSHYMMHFEMVSMKVAKKEHANVNQCFLCHQTTSWNDIKGVGWYKHH